MVEIVHDFDFLSDGLEDRREYLALERLLLFAQSQAENMEDTALADLCGEAAKRCISQRRAEPMTNAP